MKEGGFPCRFLGHIQQSMQQGKRDAKMEVHLAGNGKLAVIVYSLQMLKQLQAVHSNAKTKTHTCFSFQLL